MTEPLSAQRKEALMSTYLTFDELLANGDYKTVELLLQYLATLVPFVPPSVIISALTITKKHTPARHSLYHRLFQFLAERDNEEMAAKILQGLEPNPPCDKSETQT